MSNYGVFKRIPPYDISRTKFNTYKTWSLTKLNFLSASVADDSHLTYLSAVQPNPANYYGGVVTYGSSQTANDNKNVSVTNNYLDSEYYASAVWYSLNHLYYNDPYSYNSYGNLTHGQASKNLYCTASVISIPQKLFGDTVKPGSVSLNIQGLFTSASFSASFQDDGFGNLIDTSLSASVGQVNNKLYLGFNEFKYNAPTEYNIPFSDFSVTTRDVTYADSDIIHIWSDSGSLVQIQSGSIGLCATFVSSSYIQIRENGPTPFTSKVLSPEINENFALSFWIFVDTNLASVSGASYNTVISKRREGLGYVNTNGVVQYTEIDYDTNKFPYEIRITATGSAFQPNFNAFELQGVRSDGTNSTTITHNIYAGVSGSIYRDNKPRNAYHIVYQKSGSMMELYADGVLSSTIADSAVYNFNNNCDLFLGNLGKNHGGFAGTLDEINFFNRALTTSEILQLSGHANSINNNVVGNVFYEHGIIVISDPRPKYNAISYYGSSWNPGPAGPGSFIAFDVNYKSKLPIEEVEVLCRLREDEFTFSNNPTILKDYRYPDVINDITSSYWSPYVTTIGLYNDKAELLAVAKLSNPVPKLTTTDLNFLIRFDI